MYTHLPAIIYASRYRKVHLGPAFSSRTACFKVCRDPVRGRSNPVPPVGQGIVRYLRGINPSETKTHYGRD
jgi:hypothetical protein